MARIYNKKKGLTEMADTAEVGVTDEMASVGLGVSDSGTVIAIPTMDAPSLERSIVADLPFAPPNKSERVQGQLYRRMGKPSLWSGEKWHCEHNAVRAKCKLCQNANKCPHGKRKTLCAECGGGALCVHQKRRERCVDCGGGSICEHKRMRHRCKECNGRSICPHGRHRHICVDCGGTSICAHGRRRHRCKDCKDEKDVHDLQNTLHVGAPVAIVHKRSLTVPVASVPELDSVTTVEIPQPDDTDLSPSSSSDVAAKRRKLTRPDM